MENWKGFWDGLNIRKALTLLISFLFGYICIANLKDANNSKEVLLAVKDILLIIIGFYFGYSKKVSDVKEMDTV